MKTKTVRDNSGDVRKVLSGLKAGDKLLCIKTQRSTCGLGLFSTITYNAFEEGKVYKVDHLYNWNGVMVAYVVDEDGCSCWATPETFKPL